MIVIDLDGTLLRPDLSVSEHTVKTLEKCRASGVRVVYATGRGRSAEMVAPKGLFDAKISMNGATARIGEKIVYNRLIPYLSARPVLLACDRRGLKAASEYSGMHYSNFAVSEVWPHVTYYKIVDFSQHEMDAEKLNIVVERPDDATFIKERLRGDLHLHVSNDGLAMVMHNEATKARAVAELARIWNIDRPEIAAFGDDVNDIDMLNYVGTGIAMGNALPEVKAAASNVCLRNDEDGVAEWIIQNIL